MVQDGLRHRAEAHVLKAAPAASAHHEQLGVGRRGKQCRPRGAGQDPLDHRDLGVLLGLAGQQVPEILLHLVALAEPAVRVGQGAHRHQGHVAQRGLLEGEADRGLGGRGSVYACHHRAGGLVGRPPRAADDHDPPAGVPGHLPGHRSEQQAGQLAVPEAADHHHLGGLTALAQHVSGRPAGQFRAHPGGAKHRLRVRQPAGQDLLTVLPGQVAKVRLGGQRHLIGLPGEADGQRRSAGLGFPGGPAQRVTAAGGPVIAGHDSVSHLGHGDLLALLTRPPRGPCPEGQAWSPPTPVNRAKGPGRVPGVGTWPRHAEAR